MIKEVYVIMFNNGMSDCDRLEYIVSIYNNKNEAMKAKKYFIKLEGSNNYYVKTYELNEKFFAKNNV